MNERIEALLPEVSGFAAEQWRDWLSDVAGGRPSTPPFSVDHDLASQELMQVADALSALGRDAAFEEGLVLAVQHLAPRPVNSYTLLVLIELVGGLTPLSGRLALWNLLQRRDLGNLVAAKTRLEITAVAALLAYGVDTALLEYSRTAALRDSDLNLISICFRIMQQSQSRSQACSYFMPLLLKACRSERDYLRVADEVKSLSESFCFEDFLRWSLNLPDPDTLGERLSSLTQALRKSALPYLNKRMPVHARMLELVVMTVEDQPTAKEAVAKLRALLSCEPVDVRQIVDFSILLWRRIRNANPRHIWALEPTSKFRLAANTVKLWRQTPIEDDSDKLDCVTDGLLLNVLNIALVTDPVLQKQYTETLLDGRNVRELGQGLAA